MLLLHLLKILTTNSLCSSSTIRTLKAAKEWFKNLLEPTLITSGTRNWSLTRVFRMGQPLIEVVPIFFAA
jgi:hypothetical protein